MGRLSVKQNKTKYQLCREELGYSREKAGELLGWITSDRIEKIENGKVIPRPEEVLEIAKVFKYPTLCNYYCANQCPVGKQYVPEINVKDLSQIILEMLASLNAVQKRQERLIDITSDGHITTNEVEDFIRIQDELERISVTVESLQLWTERMLAIGVIDSSAYQEAKKKMYASK